MSQTLKSWLIRLGSQQPELQDHLRPVLDHLSRSAAAIKIPPKMLRQALSWYPDALVLNMAKQVDQALKKWTPPEPEGDRDRPSLTTARDQFQLLNTLAMFPVPRPIPFDKTIRFFDLSQERSTYNLRVVVGPSDTEAQVTVKGRTHLIPLAEVEEFVRPHFEVHGGWVLETVNTDAYHMEEYQHRINYAGGEEEVARKRAYLESLKEELAPYLSRVRSRKLSTTIPLDLTGWYYSTKEWRDRVPEEVQIQGLHLGVRFVPDRTFNAEFDPAGPSMTVDIPDPTLPDLHGMSPTDLVKKSMRLLENAVKHEMRHFAQLLVDRWTGADAFNDEANFKGKDHDLLEFEFDAILGDEVEEYKYVARRVPARLHKVLFRLWVAQFKEARRMYPREYAELRQWVEDNPMPSNRGVDRKSMLKTGRRFFVILKRKDPERYRSAVRQFASAVG